MTLPFRENPEITDRSRRRNDIAADAQTGLGDLMLASSGCAPEHFRLGHVQLKTIGLHPSCNVIHATRDPLLQPQDIRWRRVATDLRIVSMKTHVSKVVSGCFAVLRRLRSIRPSVTRSVFVSLVVTLVLSRLDYGNATLVGIPDRLMNRVRSVLNAAARLIHAARRTEHVTPLLRDLHWLRYPERIEYKLATLAYRCLHGLGPSYLADEFIRVSEIGSRRHLRSALTASLVVPRFRWKTLGGRAFPVAAAPVWNGLPSYVTSCSSLTSFKRCLKTELFHRSYV